MAIFPAGVDSAPFPKTEITLKQNQLNNTKQPNSQASTTKAPYQHIPDVDRFISDIIHLNNITALYIFNDR